MAGTIVGTGASSKANIQSAAEEAVRMAMVPLAGRAPAFGLLFAGPERDLGAALALAKETSGCSRLIASSTAGEFTERGLTHGGVAVMLVATDMTSEAVMAKGLKEDHRRVAMDLDERVSKARHAAASKEQRRLTTVLLTDGLVGKGEDLVLELHDRAKASQIVGGAAGDEGAFIETRVGCSTDVATNAAAALHIFSEKPWGIGVGHGLRPTTKPMRVTKAMGNVVHQVNNAPAFEIYKAHAAQRGLKLTPANASPYMIANELGIHFFDKVSRARAPLSASPDGSLTCAAAIPEGAMISILDGDPDSMVSAASSAAEEAREHLAGAQAAGVIVFDCVCRGMILKESFQREISAVRDVFGDVPVAGFLTYGEIARYQGRLEGWHNTTAVVVAIPK
jgi:methyl-accepting chemotaxis protein